MILTHRGGALMGTLVQGSGGGEWDSDGSAEQLEKQIFNSRPSTCARQDSGASSPRLDFPHHKWACCPLLPDFVGCLG